jgi:hypothetical protein
MRVDWSTYQNSYWGLRHKMSPQLGDEISGEIWNQVNIKLNATLTNNVGWMLNNRIIFALENEFNE